MDNRANFSWAAAEIVKKLWASGARAVLYTDGGFRPQQQVAASTWVMHMITRSGEWVNVAQGARIHQVTERTNSMSTEAEAMNIALHAVVIVFLM